MKATINSTLIKNLPEGKDIDIYDDRQRGFVLRVRKSGRHSYRVHYARGRWMTICRVGDLSPTEARVEAKAIIGAAAKGNDPAASKRRAKAATLRDYLNNVYEPYLESRGKRGSATVKRLLSCFGDDLGRRRLPEITPWLVDKWRTGYLKNGRTTATINREVGALKSALNRAVEWGIIDQNPIATVKPLKVDRHGVVRYLSLDEETRLRQALVDREAEARKARESANAWRQARGYKTKPDYGAYTDYLRPLVLLAINTGLRRGELFNLKWRDVDMDRQTLVVRGIGAKSGQTRYVPLNPEAVEVLKTWRDCTNGTGHVFAGDDGRRLVDVKKAWAGLLKRSGIAGFRFHDIRHHFASQLVMRGVDLNTVRDLLGHANLNMTLRYAHLSPDHKAEAVNKLSSPVERGKQTA
jgi:integrase